MPLRITCPEGHTLIVSEARGGSTLRCPRCQARVIVPVAAAGREGRRTKEAAPLTHAEAERASTSVLEAPPQRNAPAEDLEEPEPPPVVAPCDIEPPPVQVKPKSRAIMDPKLETVPPPVVEPVPAAIEPEPPAPAARPEAPVAAPRPAEPEAANSELAASATESAPAEVPAPVAPPPPAIAEEPALDSSPPELEPPVESAPPAAEPVKESAPATEELKQSPASQPLPATVETPAAPAPHAPAAPRAVTASPEWRLAAYVLALSISAAGIFGMGPGIWDVGQYWLGEGLPVTRWAIFAIGLGLVHLAYGVYLAQLPDWTSSWMVTLFSLAVAAVYAGLLGVTLLAGPESFLIRGLELEGALPGGRAAIWCLCMTSVMTSLAFFAGRMSVRWRRAELRGIP